MRWFIFCKNELLLSLTADGRKIVPTGETPPVERKPWAHEFALMAYPDARAFVIDSPINTEGYAMMPLRSSYYELPLSDYQLAGKFYELTYWDLNTRYCGVCGAPNRFNTEISKLCPECGKEIWPQVSTAVIVRITRGDEVFMVRARNFRGDFYGLVAGFVETGETLEEAVAREVHEETGLTITNLHYFGSQPWPYPCGLMVGFTAEYAGGEPHLQREELSSGGWFHRDHLPKLPEPLSIARKLIDNWTGKREKTSEKN